MRLFWRKNRIDIPIAHLVKKKGKAQTYKIRKAQREITVAKININHKWTTLQKSM